MSKFALCNSKMLSEIIADVGIFVISSAVRTLDVNSSVYVCMTEKLVYVVGLRRILMSSDKVKILWSLLLLLCMLFCCGA